jgi:hypothetical protein
LDKIEKDSEFKQKKMDFTKTWKNSESVAVAMKIFTYEGIPPKYSETQKDKSGYAIWNFPTSKFTDFKQISVFDNNFPLDQDEIYCIPDFEKNEKDCFSRIVQVTVKFDLAQVKQASKLFIDFKAPVSFNVQKKELTAYGKSFEMCIGILQVLTNCATNGIKPETVIANNVIQKCNEYINSDPEKNFAKMFMQLKINLNALPGNPLSITQ